MNTVTSYKGVKLRYEDESGFYASFGNEEFGYCETVEDLKAEIDDFFAGDEHGPLNGYFGMAR